MKPPYIWTIVIDKEGKPRATKRWLLIVKDRPRVTVTITP